jgi:hypothetical protein
MQIGLYDKKRTRISFSKFQIKRVSSCTLLCYSPLGCGLGHRSLFCHRWESRLPRRPSSAGSTEASLPSPFIHPLPIAGGQPAGTNRAAVAFYGVQPRLSFEHRGQSPRLSRARSRDRALLFFATLDRRCTRRRIAYERRALCRCPVAPDESGGTGRRCSWDQLACRPGATDVGDVAATFRSPEEGRPRDEAQVGANETLFGDLKVASTFRSRECSLVADGRG